MSARYCGSCATPLVARPASHGTVVRQSCPACRTTVYETTSIVVATLPVVDDRVVLIRRGIEPGRGRWAYAGGYLEAGETLEAGALRETEEETGLAVEITGLLGVYSRPSGRSITVVFGATADSDRGEPGAEALEVRAFAPADIPWDELAFWTATYALEDWLYARERGLMLPRAWRVGPARL
jgi:ADP-ribose pyrophosphatase YjhB (NUDIX family)